VTEANDDTMLPNDSWRSSIPAMAWAAMACACVMILVRAARPGGLLGPPTEAALRMAGQSV
jgi:hypothetical protein